MHPSPRLAVVATLALLLTGCAAADGGATQPPPSTAAADPSATPTQPGTTGTPPGPTSTPPGGPQAGTPGPGGETAAEDVGSLIVVSTVAPVADVVARVLGDRGRVETLIPAGADSHTYEPRPQDVAILEGADAFLGVGLGLNDASVRLAQANLPGGAPLVLLAEEALDGEDLVAGDGHTHDGDGHTHDGDGHTHGGDAPAGDPNPHVWTSVRNVMRLAEHAAAVLAELDPEDAEGYERRARALLSDLRALDEAVTAAVQTVPPDARKLVVYHDAWRYFGRDHGLEVVAAVQPSDFSEPSAADVRAIIDQIRAEDVPAVFGSEEFPTDVLGAITGETGARYVGDITDDTLPGRPGEPRHSYAGMIVHNARAIVEALGGDPAPLDAVPLGG